ncbi:unnamed protein product [Lymnaea stagnalis]|uniref:ABC transporter family G domain-containing protein n=1 Tax=Lymnaea stagnalis TaxID=6523 RepID=A0AAV2H3R4_LYMST
MAHESCVAMWDVIKKIVLCGRTVIFTSQSATECKALSSRLAILVKGKLIYDGSPKDIMVRHAHGLTVTIHAKTDDKGQPVPLVDVVLYVKEGFPQTKLIAEGEESVHLYVPINNKPIYRLFATLQMAHHKIGFEKFLIRYTTMEDVYTMFQHVT